MPTTNKHAERDSFKFISLFIMYDNNENNNEK